MASASGMASASDAERVIGLIDLTDLNDGRDPTGLRDLVDRALEHGVPAVCIWPEFVEMVASALEAESERGTCLIATVVNFPGGDGSIADVSSTTRAALAAGADEIDLVLPYRDLMAGDVEVARAMVEAVGSVVHDHVSPTGRRAELKVILETGELDDLELIAQAAHLAIDSGADFIKTSTGKTPVSATLGAFEVIVGAVATADRPIGVKPSGGIRTVAEAVEYLAIVDSRLGADWATPESFRFGASSLLDDAIAVALTA